jgi:predicted transcriptional regulator
LTGWPPIPADRDQLADQATADFVAEERELLARIDRGIADAAAGRVVAHEEMAAWLDRWGEAEAPSSE